MCFIREMTVVDYWKVGDHMKEEAQPAARADPCSPKDSLLCRWEPSWSSALCSQTTAAAWETWGETSRRTRGQVQSGLQNHTQINLNDCDFKVPGFKVACDTAVNLT